MKTLSVLVPLYNEEEAFPRSLRVLTEQLDALEGWTYELVFVDDGSTDATWTLVQEAAATRPQVGGLSFSRNFGKEAALCAGLDVARGDAVLLLDGDLQHPPACIPEFLRLHDEGWEIVDGVKTDRGKESGLHKKLVRGFYHLFQASTGIDLENASDFKLLDRKVVDAWKQLHERSTFFRGLTDWLGFKRVSLPFAVEPRREGKTKWSFSHLVALALRAVTSFSCKPLYLVAWLGVLFLLAAIVLGIHTLVMFFLGRALGGFTTVILLQLITGGFIMLSLGLIGLYVGEIFVEIKGRPRYLVRETVGKTPLKEPND